MPGGVLPLILKRQTSPLIELALQAAPPLTGLLGIVTSVSVLYWRHQTVLMLESHKQVAVVAMDDPENVIGCTAEILKLRKNPATNEITCVLKGVPPDKALLSGPIVIAVTLSLVARWQKVCLFWFDCH